MRNHVGAWRSLLLLRPLDNSYSVLQQLVVEACVVVVVVVDVDVDVDVVVDVWIELGAATVVIVVVIVANAGK